MTDRAAALTPVLPAAQVTEVLQLLDRLLGDDHADAWERYYLAQGHDRGAAYRLAEGRGRRRVSGLLAGLLSGISEGEPVSELGLRWALRRGGEYLAEAQAQEGAGGS